MTTGTNNHIGTAAFMKKLRDAIKTDNEMGILTVNLNQPNQKVAQELITQIAENPDGTIYSPALTALYNEIPSEWFAGIVNIPTAEDDEEHMPAACFGEFKGNSVDCKNCLQENTDEALRCQEDKIAKNAAKAKNPKTKPPSLRPTLSREPSSTTCRVL